MSNNFTIEVSPTQTAVSSIGSSLSLDLALISARNESMFSTPVEIGTSLRDIVSDFGNISSRRPGLIWSRNVKLVPPVLPGKLHAIVFFAGHPWYENLLQM